MLTYLSVRGAGVPLDNTSAEESAELRLEIAHLLLIDVVGYSALLVNEQVELLRELNKVVRSCDSFRAAEAADKLIRIPTGDGMALLFFNSPEEPARCALEISQRLKDRPNFKVRMGVHSGPINRVEDVNDQSNIAGAGINVAQRVMDCGDAGHILLSKHVADDLAQYRHWRSHLHDLGECEVKHGLRLHIVNLCKDGLGNPEIPSQLRHRLRWRPKSRRSEIRPVSAPRFPIIAVAAALALSFAAIAFCVWLLFHGYFPGRSQAQLATAGGIQEKSIAVLPFASLSDEKQNAYFADGIQDEILSDLAKVSDLKVISRTSVMQYKTGATRNLRAIANDLGVTNILEGTVQRVGDRIKVSAQLIEARTDTHIWADQYERDLANVFQIQDEVAEKIVTQLKAKLSPNEKTAIEERSTDDLAAYHFYLQARDLIFGIAFSARAKEDVLQAVQLLEQAISRDPSFFLAYCELAGAHDRIYFLGFDHTEERLNMADQALKAVHRLKPESGEGHLANAQHLYWGYRDYSRAREELAKARPLLPNEPLLLVLTGYIDRREGQWDKSTQEMARALELDPRNLYILQQVSFNYQNQRRYKEMAAVLDRVLAIQPKDINTRIQRAVVDLEWRADTRPLHAAFEQISAEDPEALSTVIPQWITLTLSERDFSAADRAIAAAPPDGLDEGGFRYPISSYHGLIAHARGDVNETRRAFTAARTEVEKIVCEQPTYPEALSVLGIIDAALGNKEDAISEGRRAIDLLPVTKDALAGPKLVENLATIYAWTGEKALACERLQALTAVPSSVSYGSLRLSPHWDPMRGDACFEKIVASLAPRD